MTNQNTTLIIEKIFKGIQNLIPVYMSSPPDKVISNGNVAICIIDETGFVYGKMYGTDKRRLRHSYRVAWMKASQVWLTGIKTGEYERRLFNGEFPENGNGIESPDLIGGKADNPSRLQMDQNFLSASAEFVALLIWKS